MKLILQKEKIIPELYKLIFKLDSGEYVIEIKKARKLKSRKQENALHLLFRQWADELNSAGWDMRKTLKDSVDIPWDEKRFKEQIWKPIQEAMFSKKSTTELESYEIDKIFAVINKHIGEKTGIGMNFPSINSLINDN